MAGLPDKVVRRAKEESNAMFQRIEDAHRKATAAAMTSASASTSASVSHESTSISVASENSMLKSQFRGLIADAMRAKAGNKTSKLDEIALKLQHLRLRLIERNISNVNAINSKKITC